MKGTGVGELLQLFSLFTAVSSEATWPAVSAVCLETLRSPMEVGCWSYPEISAVIF